MTQSATSRTNLLKNSKKTLGPSPNAFEAKHAALRAEDPAGAEDPDEYLAENVFWVPALTSWLKVRVTRTIGVGFRVAIATHSCGGGRKIFSGLAGL